MSLGQRIRELREKQGISQSALARQSGVSDGYISKLENDLYRNPSADRLLKLARTLRVPVEDLYHAAGYIAPASSHEVEDDDPELTLYLSQIHELPKRDREIIKMVLRTMLDEQARRIETNSAEPASPKADLTDIKPVATSTPAPIGRPRRHTNGHNNAHAFSEGVAAG